MQFSRRRYTFVSPVCALTISVFAAAGSPASQAQVPGVPSTGGYGVPSNSPPPIMMNGQVATDVAPAQKLLSEGKYSQAEAMYREYLTNNPQDLLATAGLGIALANQFKLDGATQLFDRVLAQDPNNALAYVGRATVTLNRLQSSNGLIRSERDSMLKLAEQFANQSCTLSPANGEAHYTLACVLKEEGHGNEAASEFRNALNFDPRMSFAYSGLGSVELDQNSLAQSESDFKQAIALNSGNSTGHYGLGATYLKQGRIEDAIGELNTSLYQFPNSWPVRMALGQAYAAQGNTAAALQQYQLSTLIKPENGEPYLRMADIRQDRGDLELALADLHSGLTQSPYDLDLRQRIADIRLKLDKADDAIKDYRTILQMSPNNPAALKGLSQALYLKAQKAAASAVFASNDYEAAFKALDEAIKINPNDMELLLAEAKLMSLSGQKPDLSKMHQPSNEAETVAYASALRTSGDFARSGAMLKSVIDAQNDSKQAFALGDIAVLNRDLDNAEYAYQKGLTLSGTPQRGQRGLDQVQQLRKSAVDEMAVANELLKKKQYDGAIAQFRTSLAANPNLADARLGLAQALEKATKVNAAMLTDAVTQYQYYMSLKTDLPEKDRQKITEDCNKLSEKSFKLKEKEAKNPTL